MVLLIMVIPLEELVDKYIDELSNDKDFIRLLELKKIIDDKYKKEILIFKTCEEKYIDSEKYQQYIDISGVRKELSVAKANLYSKEEVKEYFDIERKIQNKINEDIDKIKSSISNKFTLSNEKSICHKIKK